jgi:hypothetical protein
MATAPTAEGSARRILSIFAEHNLRAGENAHVRQIIYSSNVVCSVLPISRLVQNMPRSASGCNSRAAA